ncbi:MAG: LacI family DNA-binding transcriptional regulator [Lachnospiraceae bacterium]|nr:LacI family DNA-binding transcriptional regulator [Lachnospiraceae bacterium]
MVTIKDVAREAGVAISTVSNVLNNVNVVSEEKRKKVLEVAKRLGYVPNMNARMLKSSKKNTIGFFCPSLQGYFYNILLSRCQIECQKSGYLFNVYICNEIAENEVVDIIGSSGVAGAVIINMLNDKASVDRLKSFNMPIVFLDREICGEYVSSITIDNYSGVKGAVDYLIEQGKTKIGYIFGENCYDSYLRYKAYLDSLSEHGLSKYDDFYLQCFDKENVAYEEVSRLLQQGVNLPDAIFSDNDDQGFGCIKALKDNGIKVPRDIAVVGFDEVPMAAYYNPPLTTVHSPISEMGYEAAKEIVRLINSDNKEGSHKMLPTTFVIRESV